MNAKSVGEKVLSLFGEPEIITMLKADHRKVENLFNEFEEAKNSRQKQRLITDIVNELTVHATMEEEIVYPAIMREEECGTREAFEEHHVVKGLLRELSKMNGTEENVDAKVKVLSELIAHHVQEEESELLPKLRDSGEDLDMMAETVMKRKERMLNRIRKAS